MARKKKYDKPLTLDMDFNEALERFAATAPSEVASAAQDERVRLVEREGSAHPLLIYATPKGVNVDLAYRDGTFWATQQQMADMFGVARNGISEHLSHIYAEGELIEEATSRKIREVRLEGGREVNRELPQYDLNALISVGYRVGSKQGTMFRIWSTERLVQILTKGFYIDKEHLRTPVGRSHIDEIKDILQDLRSDQANVHRELSSICAQCQDYDPKDPKWKKFFRNTSAAIFYAAVQQTPSEVIKERANANKLNMGLVTFPKERVWKDDVKVGKNYLGQTELNDLNRFSSLLLDFILDQAKAGRMTTMELAQQHIVQVTKMSGRRVLDGGGDAGRKQSDAHAHAQYAIYDSRIKAQRRERGDRLFDESNDN